MREGVAVLAVLALTAGDADPAAAFFASVALGLASAAMGGVALDVATDPAATGATLRTMRPFNVAAEASDWVAGAAAVDAGAQAARLAA